MSACVGPSITFEGWGWFAIDPDYIGIKAYGRTEEEALAELERLKREVWSLHRLCTLQRDIELAISWARSSCDNGGRLFGKDTEDWARIRDETRNLITLFKEKHSVTLGSLQSNEAKVLKLQQQRRKALSWIANFLRGIANFLQPEMCGDVGDFEVGPAKMVLPSPSLGE